MIYRTNTSYLRCRTATTLAVSVSLLFFPFLSVYADGSTVSIDSPSLSVGYSLYSDLTGTQGQTTVQYGDGILNSLKNASTTSCVDQAQNVGNNGDTFVFATCQFPNLTPPSFTANTNLLALWQVGSEDVRADITNKAKFYIYAGLFTALKNTYAYNKGYTLYARDNSKLPTLNTSYFNSIDAIKKNIPVSFLISHSGAYQVSALDFLYQSPEIAPNFYYSEDQYNRYKKFENSTLTVAKKIQAIKNKTTLSKLKSALLKVLKDPKKKMNNDEYLKYIITYQIALEQK